MSWQERPVLVTGAGGFIGSHLVEALASRGARVRALVRYNSRGHRGHLEKLPPALAPQVEVVAGDVTDPFAVDRAVAGREVVFHLAALIGIPYSYVAPGSYVDVNVRGTLNVLEAARHHEVRRVLPTSTSEVYGTARYAPIDEAHPLQGQSPYSASKIAADKIAESYHLAFGLPVTVVRPFNTYGPRQSARAVIPSIITQALVGPEVRLGSLEPVRDMNFVTDTVRGFLALAEAPQAVGRVVNLATGRGVSVGELAESILGFTDSKAAIVTDPGRVRPDSSEVWKLLGDARQAHDVAGWRSEVPLEEGLKATISYVRDHLDEYRPGHYEV